MSPIEPIWFDWKNIIRAGPPIRSIQQLKEAARSAWGQLTFEQINRQVMSMPNRVNALIAARGGTTGY